ncbi:hypothetical protein [Haloterrigena salifodinae]|uniref:hypothetical protein n=1 Tax=Haloterrigena salifodinae TaxID=2675099 RepID=UPI000F860107|nr:hypothetical protein [Haloterrigena salifodinae]
MNRRAVIAGAGSATLLTFAGCIFVDGTVEADRGDIAVVVDGEPINLSAERFQSENVENDSIKFHLHEDTDDWFMEGKEPVTFAEGIDLLPHFAYAQRDGDHVVTVDGTAYDGREPRTELTFLVDDDPVDPTEYVVDDGDELRLEITTDADASDE